MYKLAILIMLSSVLAGCGSSSSESTTDDATIHIWTEGSQRIVIDRFNGWTPDVADRNTQFDYTKDVLPEEAIDFLSKIMTTTPDEICVADGKSYDVVITDSSGLEQEFYSTNKFCNNSKITNAIDILQLDELVLLLP